MNARTALTTAVPTAEDEILGTAHFIKNLPGFTGDARLYRLDPPYENATHTVSHVVVSGTYVMGTPETYIFPADERGGVLDWLEMDGSFRDSIDHEAALQGLGYGVRS